MLRPHLQWILQVIWSSWVESSSGHALRSLCIVFHFQVPEAGENEGAWSGLPTQCFGSVARWIFWLPPSIATSAYLIRSSTRPNLPLSQSLWLPAKANSQESQLIPATDSNVADSTIYISTHFIPNVLFRARILAWSWFLLNTPPSYVYHYISNLIIFILPFIFVISP